MSDARPPEAPEPGTDGPSGESAPDPGSEPAAAEPPPAAAEPYLMPAEPLPGGPGPTAVPEPAPAQAPSPAVAATPPVAPVWPRVGAVLSGAFDLVTQARGPLRNASLYVGLLGLLTMGPALIAIVADPAFNVDFDVALTSEQPGIDLAALYLLLFALVAVALESQIIGLAIVAGARSGRPLSLARDCADRGRCSGGCSGRRPC